MMMDYDWPGNVRELQNTVARCVLLSSRGCICAEDLPERIRALQTAPTEYSLARNERSLIVRVMRECNWNKHKAAQRLKISRSTLYSKIRRHGLEKRAISV